MKDKDLDRWKAQKKAEEDCPHCGRCRHCGRSAAPYPYPVPMPVYPYPWRYWGTYTAAPEFTLTTGGSTQ